MKAAVISNPLRLIRLISNLPFKSFCKRIDTSLKRLLSWIIISKHKHNIIMLVGFNLTLALIGLEKQPGVGPISGRHSAGESRGLMAAATATATATASAI